MVKLAMIGAGGYAFELIKRIWQTPEKIELVAVSSSPARKSAGRTARLEKGVPVKSFSKAGFLASRMAFDALLPFALMVFISYFTKTPDKAIINRFYVKMKTPVSLEDARELEKSFANPTRFDHLKLFPKSNWEFCKWTKYDTMGFSLCWVGVAFVLVLLWVLLSIGG